MIHGRHAHLLMRYKKIYSVMLGYDVGESKLQYVTIKLRIQLILSQFNQ